LSETVDSALLSISWPTRCTDCSDVDEDEQVRGGRASSATMKRGAGGDRGGGGLKGDDRHERRRHYKALPDTLRNSGALWGHLEAL
jgi:hypothetical protein